MRDDPKADLRAARTIYADALDNLSKYARVECTKVRAGEPWDEDGIMGPLLRSAARDLEGLNEAAARARG